MRGCPIDNATLKVKVYDLLDENVSMPRIVGEDFIQDTQNLILERYAMLSFTYKFSNFGGANAGPRFDGRSRIIRMYGGWN